MIKYTVASIQSEASQSDARSTIFFFYFLTLATAIKIIKTGCTSL